MKKITNALKLNLFWIWAVYFLLLIISILYIFKIRPWLYNFTIYGEPPPLLISPSDTYTYWLYATTQSISVIPITLMGPVLIIKLLRSFDLIFVFNIVIFFSVLVEFYRYTKIKIMKFAFFLLINPLVMFQFFGPNKEIYMIVSLLAMVLYTYSKNYKHLFFSLLIACFSKPEFVMIQLFFIFLYNLNRGLRFNILIMFIVLLTLFYSDLPGMGRRTEALMVGQNNSSIGISVLLQNLATKFFFFPGIIIAKTLINILEGVYVIVIHRIFDGFEFANLISGILIFSILVNVLLKIKLSILNNEILLMILFVLMVATVPFPHHRYISPIYVLLLSFSMNYEERS